jgi:hypothetical protein
MDEMNKPLISLPVLVVPEASLLQPRRTTRARLRVFPDGVELNGRAIPTSAAYLTGGIHFRIDTGWIEVAAEGQLDRGCVDPNVSRMLRACLDLLAKGDLARARRVVLKIRFVKWLLLVPLTGTICVAIGLPAYLLHFGSVSRGGTLAASLCACSAVALSFWIWQYLCKRVAESVTLDGQTEKNGQSAQQS